MRFSFNIDPHKFGPGNQVYEHLVGLLRERSLERCLMKLKHVPTAIIPTYTHVLECEDELMENIPAPYSVQSEPIGSLQEVLESQTVFVVESTIDLIAILSDRSLMNNGTSVMCVLKLYMRAVTGKTVAGMLRWVMNELHDVLRLFTEPAVQSDPEGYENPVAQIRRIIDCWDKMKTHPLAKKLAKIFHYMLSASLLERFGITYERCFFSKAEAEASERMHASKHGFFGAVLDGVLYIVERLYDVYRTGSWQPILHTGSQYAQWVDEVYKLLELSKLLHNPEANGVNYHEYVQRLNNAIEKGDALIKYSVDLDVGAMLSAKRLLSEVKMLKANHLTKSAARESRDAPFSLLFFGGSSIGKSSLLEAVHNYFAKLHKLPLGDDYRYTRSFSDEYWSGFTSSVWSLTLDDVASRNPNLGEDKSMEEVIQILNNVPYTPPQADLADKGKTPLRPKLVMATTNVKHLSALAYYQSELAIRRRLPFVITPTLKSEFAKEVGGVVPSNPYDRMLDSAKTSLCESSIPNFWDFKIEKVEARPSMQEDLPQGAILTMVESNLDIFGLLKFVGVESRKHFQNQDLVRKSKNELELMEVCEECLNVAEACVCVQGSIMEDITASTGDLLKWAAVASACVVMPPPIVLGSVIAANVASAYDYQRVKSRLRQTGMRIRQDMLDYTVMFGQEAVHGVARNIKRDVLAPIVGVKRTSLKYVKHTVCKLQQVRETLARGYFDLKERHEHERIMMRDYFYQQGEKVRTSVVANPYLKALLVGIPSLLVAYKLYTTFKSLVPQGSIVDGENIVAQDEKPNVWFRDEYEPSTFEVGRLSASWKALSFDDVVRRISENVVCATFRYPKAGVPMRRDSKCLCVGGNLYVTTAHCIPDYVDVQASIVTSPVGDGINGNFTILLTQRDIYRPENSDLAFFRLNNVPPKKNLVDCVPGETFRTVCNGAKILRNEDGQIRVLPARGIRQCSKQIISSVLTGTFQSWSAKSCEDTVQGDCGSPLVADTPQGPHILGLHQTGGYRFESTSVQLTRELVDAAIEHFKLIVVQCGTPNLLDLEREEIPLNPLHHKSPVRFIQEGVANAYGSFGGFRPKHVSKVTDTFISAEMQELGYEVKTGKPVMAGWKPWHAATSDIVKQTFQAKQSVIDACADSFADEILERLPAGQLEEIKILTDLATVNGLPGVKFVDKMNRNTSMGFPYNKKKKFFLSEPHAEDIWADAVDFDDDFYDRVNHILTRYKNRERHMPVYTGHLKDEPTKFSKIESGLTRVFCGAPADWSFVMRKYLLTTVRVMQNNKYIFEAAPGTNATSLEWEEMYRYLTSFGKDRMIAGDFSKFDKRMSAQWIIAAFHVLDRILEAAGWSEDDRAVVVGIGYDVAFPLCNMNGDLIEFWGSNPSGHPLTVIINSIVNALYMRYAWFESGNALSDFKKQVHLMTYGDDNVMGVSRKCTTFGHTVIQEQMEKIGVKYTMADKESASVPFIDIDEISFLKRRWRFDPEIGSHVAQLEEDSIAKMLTKCLPSKWKCPEQQAVDLMGNALSEYFFYGRETFDAKRKQFLRVIEKLDLTPFYTMEYPVFDELKERYFENSKDVVLGW